MDTTERQVIDELFDKLARAEKQSGPRDVAAEAHIAGLVRRQAGAPYYMAQAIVVQEQAIQAAQARIQQLEDELAARPAQGAGGFLGGLFGGTTARAQPPKSAELQQLQRYQRGGPFGGGGGGSSFLGGAMQTAMGVAGGVVLGNILMDAFSGTAEAATGLAEDAAGFLPGEEEIQAAEDAFSDTDGGFEEY